MLQQISPYFWNKHFWKQVFHSAASFSFSKYDALNIYFFLSLFFFLQKHHYHYLYIYLSSVIGLCISYKIKTNWQVALQVIRHSLPAQIDGFCNDIICKKTFCQEWPCNALAWHSCQHLHTCVDYVSGCKNQTAVEVSLFLQTLSFSLT